MNENVALEIIKHSNKPSVFRGSVVYIILENLAIFVAHAHMSEVVERATLTWSSVVENFGAVPRPRMSHACVTVGSTLLFLFGESGKDNERTFFNNIAAFDTESLTWTNPYAPLGAEGVDKSRSDHSATLFQNDTLVVFGGRNRECYFNDIFVSRYNNVPSAVRVEAAQRKGSVLSGRVFNRMLFSRLRTPDSELINTLVTPVCKGQVPGLVGLASYQW